VALLLRTEHMSAVFGLRLADGREVVVKARTQDLRRAAACVAAQSALARAGFSCPAPLTGVVMVDSQLAVHAEEWRPGGELLRGDDAEVARRYATVYAQLMAALAEVRVPPPLPSPQWLGWDHGGSAPWPPSEDLDRRDQSVVPDLVLATAIRATERLRRPGDLPRVLGHADFEAQNLRWKGRTLWAVYDWDSLAWMPESVLVGSAAGVFASAEVPTLAPLDSSAVFIQTYQQARGRAFSADELQLAWAASLWTTTHNARAEALFGQPPVATTALLAQAAERLARARALVPALGVGLVEGPHRVRHHAERQAGRVAHHPPILDLLDPLGAEHLEPRDLGVQVVGVKVQVYPG
jgi:hypothetical protein